MGIRQGLLPALLERIANGSAGLIHKGRVCRVGAPDRAKKSPGDTARAFVRLAPLSCCA